MSPDADELPDVYWVTRDRRHGDLRDIVEIWTVRPAREQFEDGDVMWLPPVEGATSENDASDKPHCLGEWTIGEAHTYIGAAVPDTDRECVVVGLSIDEKLQRAMVR